MPTVLTVTNLSGAEINYEAAVELMDDEIRTLLFDRLTQCSEQEFFTAYEKAHYEYHDEPWELSKVNPVW
jgi:hypothetical protein